MDKVPMKVGMGGPSRYNASNPQQASPAPTHTGTTLHFASQRRRYTASSDSAASPTLSKITANPPPSTPLPPHAFTPQQLLHLLPHTRGLPPYLSGTPMTPMHMQTRSSSPPRTEVLPTRRRLSSHSPERGGDKLANGSASHSFNGWSKAGRNIHRNNTIVNRSSVPNIHANRKKESGPPMVRRPSNRRNGPTQTTHSSSMPSTPNHHPQPSTGKSRSPSPRSYLLDSPKSAVSEPLPLTLHPPLNNGRCKYETALINCRRRFQYKIGCEYLPYEKPAKDKLSQEEDRRLTQEIDGLYQRLLPTPDSTERRRKFVLKLEKLLNSEWPGHDIRVNVFGSSENKLCTTESDVDICITTDWKELEHTCKLAKGLAKHGMQRVVCVPGAKVPIVKIWDPELSVACDMNVNNTLALENTRMIKTYVDIDPRVRPLAMIIKHWTKQRILNDAAGGATFGSYTWICMILNFLQTRDLPILPSLHERPHKKGPIINGVDCSFDDNIEGLRGFGSGNKESLGSLLFGFFKLYGHELDYEKDVISVRRGKILTKEEKRWQYGQNNGLCVEEPFNIARNLGNTADAYSVKGLHLEFRRAFKILAEEVDLNACCAKYEFPPDEPTTFVPPPPPQKTSVRLSQATSTSSRSRGGPLGGSGRGGRSYAGYGARQNSFRRASNSSAYSSLPMQPQYLPVADIYSLQASQLQHLYQLDPNQIQAHVQAQTQAHIAALQNLHSQAQLLANSLHGSGQSSASQEPGNTPIPSYIAYYARVLGLPFSYYPSLQGSEAGTVPPSPTCTSSVPETRPSFGRGRRFGSYPGRSRSQPPPNVINSPSSMQPTIAVRSLQPSDDELDYGDLSSNGSLNMNLSHPPPETPPPEEISVEYVGYYSIGESLQEEGGSSQAELGGEPFMEQKCMVDRQKRLSQEKLPHPLLCRSRPSSPLAVESINSPVFDDRGPVIVNGSSLRHSPSYMETAYRGHGMDGTPAPDTYSYSSSPPHLKLDTSCCAISAPLIPIRHYPVGVSPSRTAFAQSTGSFPHTGISLDDAHGSGNTSPMHHQNTASHQMPWPSSIGASVDVPSRVYATTQEDAPSLLTPVPEVRTPSPANARKKSDLPTSTGKSTTVNGMKASPHSTSKKPVMNGLQNWPHKTSRGKNSTPNASSSLTSPLNSGTPPEAPETKDTPKPNLFIATTKKRNKKTKKSGAASGKAEIIPETERKGG